MTERGTLVGIISDTHAPRFWRGLPDRVGAAFEGVDLILHAGDVCAPSALDDLSRIAPLRVVLGNNDGAEVAGWRARTPLTASSVPSTLDAVEPAITETSELSIDGLAVAMIHDSGPKQGRQRRMRRRFPTADLVIFGHSHIPYDETLVDEHGAVRLFNPGSPTDLRRQQHGTVGLLRIADGQLRDLRLVVVK